MSKLKDAVADENRIFSILILLCLFVLVVLTLIISHRILNIQENIDWIEDQIQQFTEHNIKDNSPSANEVATTYSGKMNLLSAHVSGELKDPRIVIIEFFDFECPYCAEASKLTDEILVSNPGQVMLVQFDYPLPFHEDSQGAALFANCINQQDMITYKEIYNYLFQNQTNLDLDLLIGYAESIGADLEAIKLCMASPESVERINQSIALGENAGIKGTPAFIVSDNFDWEEDLIMIDGQLVYMNQLMEIVRQMLSE